MANLDTSVTIESSVTGIAQSEAQAEWHASTSGCKGRAPPVDLFSGEDEARLSGMHPQVAVRGEHPLLTFSLGKMRQSDLMKDAFKRVATVTKLRKRDFHPAYKKAYSYDGKPFTLDG